MNKARAEHYREMLRDLNLGLENQMETKVGSLSGGQRQTLALLMATMNPIEFLILDEHTAALDPKTAEIIMELTDKIEHYLTWLLESSEDGMSIEEEQRLFYQVN